MRLHPLFSILKRLLANALDMVVVGPSMQDFVEVVIVGLLFCLPILFVLLRLPWFHVRLVLLHAGLVAVVLVCCFLVVCGLPELSIWSCCRT